MHKGSHENSNNKKGHPNPNVLKSTTYGHLKFLEKSYFKNAIYAPIHVMLTVDMVNVEG